MAYTFPLAFTWDTGRAAALDAGITVYGAGGAAIPALAWDVYELGTGAYLAITAAMPDAQTGVVVVRDGAQIATVAAINPVETEGRLSSLERSAVADSVWTRRLADMPDVAAADRCAKHVIQRFRNKVPAIGGDNVVHFKKEDDATDAWTAAVTTDAAAVPVTSVDP